MSLQELTYPNDFQLYIGNLSLDNLVVTGDISANGIVQNTNMTVSSLTCASTVTAAEINSPLLELPPLTSGSTLRLFSDPLDASGVGVLAVYDMTGSGRTGRIYDSSLNPPPQAGGALTPFSATLPGGTSGGLLALSSMVSFTIAPFNFAELEIQNFGSAIAYTPTSAMSTNFFFASSPTQAWNQLFQFQPAFEYDIAAQDPRVSAPDLQSNNQRYTLYSPSTVLSTVYFNMANLTPSNVLQFTNFSLNGVAKSYLL